MVKFPLQVSRYETVFIEKYKIKIEIEIIEIIEIEIRFHNE